MCPRANREHPETRSNRAEHHRDRAWRRLYVRATGRAVVTGGPRRKTLDRGQRRTGIRQGRGGSAKLRMLDV
jgi:hypothetical protein